MYREADEGAEEIATPRRRFSMLDITSGLPDDSREAEEREVERGLRDLRGRVKRARAVIAGTPSLAEILRRNWVKAAQFYARFGGDGGAGEAWVAVYAERDMIRRGRSVTRGLGRGSECPSGCRVPVCL